MGKIEEFRVYVTRDRYRESEEQTAMLDEEYAEYEIWTLSPNPNEEGWETDSGCDGYGLDKKTADYYAKCINEYPTLLSRLQIAEEALKEILNIYDREQAICAHEVARPALKQIGE